jgi:RsiW-degrading membrane proteinase PrsW (M82 family)
MQTNILPFILSFAPALLYAFMIFISFPKGTINIKTTILHFLMGALSVTAVIVFKWIFPVFDLSITTNFIVNTLIFAFIQVALVEESAKLLFYRLTESHRKKLPGMFSIMFYAMSVSAGFAVLENIMYAWQYGHLVLITRATTAIVLHMLAGLIMGYFMAIGIYKKNKMKYTSIGLLAATFIHGLYDFNIMVAVRSVPSMQWAFNTGLGISPYWILGIGMLCAYLMFTHIKKLRGL